MDTADEAHQGQIDLQGERSDYLLNGIVQSPYPYFKQCQRENKSSCAASQVIKRANQISIGSRNVAKQQRATSGHKVLVVHYSRL